MSLSISLDKFKILISLQSVKKIMQIFAFLYSDYTNFLIKYGFLHNFVAKNLCDRVSNIKNLRWQFGSIFRWLCRGVFNFFCQPCFHEEMDTFEDMPSFSFVNFSLKTRLTEKVKYTTTKPTKNTSELTYHIFDFLKLCHKDFLPKSYIKFRIL